MWIDSYKDKIDSQALASEDLANQKSKYYMKILDDLLAECDEIENFLKIGEQPAVRMRYDENLNAVPIE